MAGIPDFPRVLWRRAKRSLSYVACVREMNRRWRDGVSQTPHGLPGRLIVSLTSYPPRFPTLENTLKCLLRQTVRPDEVVLWVASADRAKLPRSVACLTGQGLTIACCDDIGPYKKIIPSLERYPDAFVAIADDDFYVWPTWLEELTREWGGRKREVLCHRIHRIVPDKDGLPLPYMQWELNSDNHSASGWNFPTGGAGTLYPPRSFFNDVLRADKFLALCPCGDDVWLYWMLLLNGVPARKVGPRISLMSWRGSQHVSLFRTNMYRNDEQIGRMIRHYGFPLAAPARARAHA